jgi:hypothetical protein
MSVSYGMIETHPEKFADRCVQLRLFANGSDVAETAAKLRARRPKGAKPVIFIFDDTKPGAHAPTSPSFIDIVARVQAWRDGDPKCINSIWISEVRIVPTAMD